MPQALRLTDRTKNKIALSSGVPIQDIQAMMEEYSVGIIRPYFLYYHYVSAEDNRYNILPDTAFQTFYRFVDEEDPCMFQEVTHR